nr:hypothetical protein GCM10010200_046580 [Actinomadura rugatobispora]
MNLRDEIENVLRAWNAYEVNRGDSPIIDFDCHPGGPEPIPAPDRLTAYRQLADLRPAATGPLATRLDADLAYLDALLGEHRPLADYVCAIQGCGTAGWPDEYLAERAELSAKRWPIWASGGGAKPTPNSARPRASLTSAMPPTPSAMPPKT